MIDKDNDIVTCDCEDCQASEPFDSFAFMASLNHIKSLGWKAVKLLSGWKHSCPRCNAKDKK